MQKTMKLMDLVSHWENMARRKWTDSENEKDVMGKKLIEHGALCYQNCARELREVLAFLSPEPSTI
jgi:hypothetical protein